MKAAWALWAGVLLISCAGSHAHEPMPAVIVGADAASRADLQRIVNLALGRSGVLLADDALRNSSELIIEPARPRDDAGHLLNGRDTRAPEHFRLLVDGPHCYLRRESTRRRFELMATHCVAQHSDTAR
jgi:hypothetical protein